MEREFCSNSFDLACEKFSSILYGFCDWVAINLSGRQCISIVNLQHLNSLIVSDQCTVYDSLLPEFWLEGSTKKSIEILTNATLIWKRIPNIFNHFLQITFTYLRQYYIEPITNLRPKINEGDEFSVVRTRVKHNVRLLCNAQSSPSPVFRHVLLNSHK